MTGHDDFEGFESRVLLSEFAPGVFEKLKKEGLQHGDVVDFGSYRGTGAFIAEPTDVHATDFYLYKTLEEMGVS